MNNLEIENTIIQTLDRHDLSECFTPDELALFETLGREEDELDRENDEIIEDFFTLNFFSP